MMTRKQLDFVAAFVGPGPARWNATRAARLAGYRWPTKVGWVLSRHPAIRPLIEAELERRRPGLHEREAEQVTASGTAKE